MSTVAANQIKVGDTVVLNDSGHGAMFKVLAFELRAGGLVMVKVTPLGGGMTMKTPLQRLQWVGGAA